MTGAAFEVLAGGTEASAIHGSPSPIVFSSPGRLGAADPSSCYRWPLFSTGERRAGVSIPFKFQAFAELHHPAQSRLDRGSHFMPGLGVPANAANRVHQGV